MRRMLVLGLLAGCASEPRIEDVLVRLKRPEHAYQIRAGWVEAPEGIEPIAERFSREPNDLDLCFASDDFNTRIFGFHSLSLSTDCERSDRVYERRLVEFDRDPRVLKAALYFVFNLHSPIYVPLDSILRYLGDADVRGEVLLALRNRAMVLSDGDPFRLFESVLAFASEWRHDILEDMTTPRMRRDRKVVAAIPLPGVLEVGSWEDWWKRYRSYLVWIPPRRGAHPRDLFHVHICADFGSPDLGGGFFLLDEAAMKAGTPTAEYRVLHPWAWKEGPNDPRWYGRY